MGKDGSAVYTWVDPNVPRILGWSAEDLVGRRALEIVHPQDQEAAIGNWIDMLHTPGPGRPLRLRHQHRDGHWVWLEVTNHNHLNDDGTGEVVADIVDISDEMATHAALEAREHLLNQLAQTVPLGLVHCAPDGTVLFANDQLTDILGVAASTTLDGLFSQVAADDRPNLDAAVRSTLQGAHGSDIEIRIDLGTSYRYCAARFRSLHDGDTCSGIIGCFEDVTISVRLRHDLEVQATFDPLTECRNRASTLDALQRSLARHRHRGASGTAVVFVDLDQFKPVNDRLGHAAGDHLLTVVAQRLQEALRSDDVVGRIGGDEFLAIAANVRQVRDAVRIANNIMTHLCQPVDLGGTVVRLAASAGVAWTDDPDADAEAVVAAADQAMYLSKQEGRCRPVMAAAPFGQQPDPAATATPIRADGASQPAPARPGSAPPAATALAGSGQS
jgi:diguanylate cyclase (GGDEF)-like protein/PAS domain S-box-containing protein